MVGEDAAASAAAVCSRGPGIIGDLPRGYVAAMLRGALDGKFKMELVLNRSHTGIGLSFRAFHNSFIQQMLAMLVFLLSKHGHVAMLLAVHGTGGSCSRPSSDQPTGKAAAH